MTTILNPNSTCVLILREDGKVLACSRKDDLDAFGFPGGKVDKGEEDLRKSAARELKEETGIQFGKHNSIYVDIDNVMIHVYSGLCEGGVSGRTYMNHCYMIRTSELDREGNWIQPQQMKGEGRVAWVNPELLFYGPFARYNQKIFDHIGYIPRMKNLSPDLLNPLYGPFSEEELLKDIEVV